MKKLFGLFIISLLGFFGFGYCYDLLDISCGSTYCKYELSNVLSVGHYCITSNGKQYGSQSAGLGGFLFNSSSDDLSFPSSLGNYVSLYGKFNYTSTRPVLSSDNIYLYGCFYNGVGNLSYLHFYKTVTSSAVSPDKIRIYTLSDFISSFGSSTCPSTGDILSGYILESSITQSYCEVEFGLITPENCPSYGSGEGTGEIMWSSFYVNDEQILGGANIYLTIPDYLKWDYIYVDQDLEIDVENEGDEEYIQGIIDINSYRPTSEDFTDIFVSGLTLVMPYIVILLFIVFVWKLLKRIFK